MLHRKRTFHHLKSHFCTTFLHSIYPAGPPVFHPWFWSVTTRNFGAPQSRNFNIYNFSLQSAGCFRETKKHLRKTIRHLEKTTKHLEKIIRQVVAPSSGLFLGQYGQKETEEALYLQEVLGLPMQIYNIFSRKANRPNCILTFRAVPPTLVNQRRRTDDGGPIKRLWGRRCGTDTPAPPRRAAIQGTQVFTKPYPTLPSREILRSFCASTANSIGSLLSTSRA